MTNLIAVLATNMVVASFNTTEYALATSGWSVVASNIAEIRLAEGGLMTSPVEAVCIVTNVTHWNNETTKEMTEKTETTEVVEVKTLKFSWEGEEYTAKRERVLSRKGKRWTRKDNWVEE